MINYEIWLDCIEDNNTFNQIDIEYTRLCLEYLLPLNNCIESDYPDIVNILWLYYDYINLDTKGMDNEFVINYEFTMWNHSRDLFKDGYGSGYNLDVGLGSGYDY